MAGTPKKPKTVTAYKAFDPGMICRGFQYRVGKTYDHDGNIKVCSSGFHAVTVPFDAWGYFHGSCYFARVTLAGKMDTNDDGDSKIAAARITIDAMLCLPDWIKAQAKTVIDLCKATKNTLAKKETECAAATGDSGHAAATGYRGHAAATGYSGHAAATGYSGHAAATGYSGHAAATGYSGHAAATGYSGHAAATGYRGHAAATGYSGHAAATGYRGHAAATGDNGHAAATGYSGHAAATGYRGHAAATGYRGHAAATGDNGHAAATGKHAIAAAFGYAGTAKAGPDGWLVLAYWNDDLELVHVRTAKVGTKGIKPDVIYKLNAAGKFVAAAGHEG